MIGMRVIETAERRLEFPGPLLGEPIVGWPHAETSSRAAGRGVRQPEGFDDAAVTLDEGAAAFVRVRLAPVTPNVLERVP